MKFVDPAFPVFVLAGLMVGETYYSKTLVPRTKALKLEHLGDASIVLHSKDIRRNEGPFVDFSKSEERRRAFHAAIGHLFQSARIGLFAVVIDKQRLQDRSLIPLNPYDVSLSQLLSLACGPPRLPGFNRPTITRVTAESRGRKEDKELQCEFQSFRLNGLSNYGAVDVQNRRAVTVQRRFPERIDFVKKSRGVTGLELADLAAYPIARAVMSKNWTGAATRVIANKLNAWIIFP
jgi:hypothetical protein